MGVRKVFTGLCRRGLVWLPTKIYTASSSSPEGNEGAPSNDETSVESNEVVFSNSDKSTRHFTRSGQRQLRFASALGLIFVLLIAFFTMENSYEGADSPQCRPVWMYPSYARIDGLDTRFTPLAQKYHLYLYREQGKDKIPIENEEISLDGAPVLFIPGNAGSFKQVRSIAAASSNLYFERSGEIKNAYTQNLDFFAADFNEDFTAFHGRTMLDQAEYLNDAIRYILSLYAQTHDYPHPLPTSVIVVGHSMGGVVARILPTLQNHVDGSIRAILTLSSPHAAAPVTFDGDILKIYEQTNDYWRSQMSDRSTFLSQNVSLVSITGGILDLMLPADYTAVEGILPSDNGFTTFSTGVPGVWTPIDHLAIVWCEQFRTRVAMLLLEIVDYRFNEKVKPLDQRIEILRKQLLTGLEKVNLPYSVTANFRKLSKKYKPSMFEGAASFKNGEKLVINSSNIDSMAKSSKFSLSPGENNPDFSLVTSITDVSIFLCKDERLELRCISATDDFISIPASLNGVKYPGESSLGSELGPFKMFSAQSNTLSEYDFVVVETPREILDDKDFVVAALQSAYSVQVVDSPLQIALFGRNIELPENAQHVGLRFTRLWDSLLSYRIHCTAYPEVAEPLPFQPFMRQWIEDPFETKWHINVGDTKIDINMHNVAPFVPVEEKHDKAMKLDIVVPPNLNLKLRMIINWPLTLKMLFIRYRLSFLSFPIAMACFTMMHQLLWYRRTGTIVSFSSVLAFLLKKYGLLITMALLILSPIVNSKVIQEILFALDPVRLNDPFMLEEQHMHTNFYYLGMRDWFMSGFAVILGLMSVAILHVLAQMFQVINHMVAKFPAQNIFQNGSSEEEEVRLADKKRLTMCLLLIAAVYFYIPYQLATAICLLIQAGNCLRVVLSSASRSMKQQENLKNYNFTILLLLIFAVTIDAPTIVVFLHNVAIRWETPFRSHHNVMAIAPIIFLVSANSTFNIVPAKTKKRYDGPITALLLGYTAFFSLIYGARNLYWIHHLINITCAWMLYTIYTGPRAHHVN